jgi:hypothetical protein
VKIKQAISVNKMQTKKVEDDDYKDILEIGDLCTLSTESLKKICFKFLPVLVTGVTTTGQEQNT